MPRLNVRYFVGVDPGKQGGAAILRVVGRNKPEIVSTFGFEKQTERDILNWFRSLPTDGPLDYCIEQVGYVPTDGGKGAFTFGQGYGFLRGILLSNDCRFEDPRPQIWQKALGIPSRKKQGRKFVETKDQFKDRLRAKAQQLFPSFPLWSEPKSLGRQRAVCDALLLAEYLRQKEIGR